MQRHRLAARAALTFLLAAGPLASCSTVKWIIPGGDDGQPEPGASPRVETPEEPKPDLKTLPAYIAKIKTYHLDSDGWIGSADPMVNFEPNYFLHGAVSRADRAARFGNYYTVYWRSKDRTGPVTLRLEYRQKLTGATVHMVEQTIESVNRSNIARFQVIGDAYSLSGPVSSWRISLLKGGEVVHTEQSFLWE